MRIKVAGIIVAFILSMAFMSCSDDASMGTLNVEVTDAPLLTDMVDAANVTITKIEVRKSEEEDEGSPYVTLFEGEEEVNLMELTNGITTQLASLEVPVGTYDLVRIYIDEAEVVLKDQTAISLTVPSASSSGLKVFIDPPVEVSGGISADLLLDFDLSRSFVAKGSDASNGFNFKPTIKAVNKSTVGRIQGVVTDAEEVTLADVEVAVYAADTLNTTTYTNDLGQYTVLGLKPGTYELVFNQTDFLEYTEEADVVVGNATSVNVTLEK